MMKKVGELRPSSRSSMNPQRLFLLYIHKLLTDSLDFEAVARDFASTNTRRINYFAIALTCRLFHLCIFLLFISENIQNVKSSPPAGREREFPPPGPTPCVARRGAIPFSAPPPKKSSYGPDTVYQLNNF